MTSESDGGGRAWRRALAATSLVAALVLLAWSSSPLLACGALAVGAGVVLLHQRGVRQSMEQRLREREALILVVVDGAIDAILTADVRGVVESFNPAAEQMFGWSSAQIVGRDVHELFAPEGSEAEPLVRTNPLREGLREAQARRRDGSTFSVSLRCRETRVGGHGVVTALARDLTGYRQTAEALQLANALLETKIADLEAHARAITLLGEMSDLLQAAVHPADAYAAIVHYARQLFPLDAGALCAAEPASDTVRVVASWGGTATSGTFPRQDCRALQSRRAPALYGGADPVACPHLSGSPAAGHVCMPINSHGAPPGIVCIRWHPGAGAGGGAEPFRTTLAAAFANQVGLALLNVRLKEDLRGQAEHDPVTGLHNRRFLAEALQRELLRAARKKSPVGVLMLDLDHFKGFNDTHGHGAGDALLRAFAAQLRRDVRMEDIACRYGGDEFAVILPETTLAQALMRAEQIREGARRIVVDSQGALLAGVTVSIGVAGLPEHGATPDALLWAADAALYSAKADGRNRTRLAPQIAEAGVDNPAGLGPLPWDWQSSASSS